jgi:ParB family chromosome partitioning protein
MGKLDQLRQLGAQNVAESTGAARASGFPAGIDPSTAVGRPARLEGVSKQVGAYRIPVSRIVRDESQPREDFDPEAIHRLAESLRTRGQLQPIRVRWDEGRGVYVILLGERRWRAATLAGLTELSCLVHEGELKTSDRLALQLVENALREDLKPIEQAKAYKALMDAEGWSGRRLAEELHIGTASVVRALSLLDLPGDVQDQVEQGTLAASVAHEITKLDDASAQAKVARATVEQGLTRDEVAEVVKAVRSRRPTPSPRPDPIDLDLGDGTHVLVRWRKANGTSPMQALRRALKIMQERERSDGQAA